jgi:hypothetical protein
MRYPIQRTILNHCRSTKDTTYFIPQGLREIRCNTVDSRAKGVTPEMLLACCVDPLGTDKEYIAMLLSSAEFESPQDDVTDLEYLKQCLHHGASGANTGRQGTGILAAALKFAQGNPNITEFVYISRIAGKRNHVFGVRVCIVGDALEFAEINNQDMEKYVKSLSEWFSFKHKDKANPEQTFLDTSNVFALFRYKRLQKTEVNSDNSPINPEAIGALMQLSDVSCGDCNVFSVVSLVLGSALYKRRGINESLSRGLRPSEYLPKIADDPITVTFKNLFNGDNDDSRGDISTCDVKVRARVVRYIESGGTRYHQSIGKYAVIGAHRAKPPRTSLTVTFMSKAECSRSRKDLVCDPIYMEEYRGGRTSDFMDELGILPIVRKQKKDKNDEKMDDFYKDADLMLNGVQLPRHNTKKNKPGASETTTQLFSVSVYPMFEIEIIPHNEGETIPGGVWCDFYTQTPNVLRKFLRNIYAQMRSRLRNPGTDKELAAMNEWLDAYRSFYNKMNAGATGLPPLHDVKKQAEYSSMDVYLFDEKAKKCSDVPLEDVPVSYINKQTFLVAFYDKAVSTSAVSPENIILADADDYKCGVEIVTANTKAYMAKYGLPLAELVIHPLTVFEPKSRKLAVCLDAANFVDQYKNATKKPVRYFPQRRTYAKCAGVDYRFSFMVTGIPCVVEGKPKEADQTKDHAAPENTKVPPDKYNYAHDLSNDDVVGIYKGSNYLLCDTYRGFNKIIGKFPYKDANPDIVALCNEYRKCVKRLSDYMLSYRKRIGDVASSEIEIHDSGFGEKGDDAHKLICNETAVLMFEVILGDVVQRMERFVPGGSPDGDGVDEVNTPDAAVA